jgi:hypothetical protein
MSRIRTLPEPDRLPALDPNFVPGRPALGLGVDQAPPRTCACAISSVKAIQSVV